MEGFAKSLAVEIRLGSGVGLWPGGTLGSGAPSGLVGSRLVASGQVGESW